MVTADSGEDLILLTEDKKYAANQEKAESIPSEAKTLRPRRFRIWQRPPGTPITAIPEDLNHTRSSRFSISRLPLQRSRHAQIRLESYNQHSHGSRIRITLVV